MTNFVNYQVELCEANATLIDKMNSLMLPGYNSGDATTAPAKTEKKTASKKESGPTMAEVKKVVKEAKAAHGEDHVRACLASVDVDDEDLTLAKAVSAVDPEQYQTFIEALNTAPEPSDDLDDEDDEEFGDDEATVSVDDVKAAVKAYAKSEGRDEAREAMKKCKAKNFADIKNISEANLTKLYGLVS